VAQRLGYSLFEYLHVSKFAEWPANLVEVAQKNVNLERGVQITHRAQFILGSTKGDAKLSHGCRVARSPFRAIPAKLSMSCFDLLARYVRDTSREYSNNEARLIGAPVVAHQLLDWVQIGARSMNAVWQNEWLK